MNSFLHVLIFSIFIAFCISYAYFGEIKPTLLDTFSTLSNDENVVQKELKDHENFLEPLRSNPFSNMLPGVPFSHNPLPAPPAFNPKVKALIYKKMKQAFQREHPDNPGYFSKQNIYDQVQFDQSMHTYYTMPSTQQPNDRELLTTLLSKDMTACKSQCQDCNFVRYMQPSPFEEIHGFNN